MINVNNYHRYESKVDVTELPEALRNGYNFVHKITQGGKSWTAYHGSRDVQKMIDTYFEKLDAFLKGKIKSPKKEADSKSPAVEKKTQKSAHNRQATTHQKENRQHKKMVEHYPEEFKFIRRFVNLNGKTKDKKQILNFINALQRSITERRMTKDSKYKKQIDFIQSSLIRNYNEMRAKIKVVLQDKVVNEFKGILGDEIIYPSVTYLKKFISLHGKQGIREKAQKLYDSINRAMKRDVFMSSDKYVPKLKEAYKSLEKFLKTKGAKTLSIETSQLNGILGACGCQNELMNKGNSLSGVEYGGRKPMVMNSMDFANLQFQRIGFSGKWKNFFGDPSPGFTIMVYSLPKFGKSTLCLDFAGYLARNHGKVLYVAREEGLDRTLQEKVNDPDVKHPNLTVSSYLMDDLSSYDYIFLDSVNKLGLTPESLEILKRDNPGKSFIYVFQTTKQGRFRGKNEFQHDVDSVVELPEIGKAVQYGRFNQLSEMEVFS